MNINKSEENTEQSDSCSDMSIANSSISAASSISINSSVSNNTIQELTIMNLGKWQENLIKELESTNYSKQILFYAQPSWVNEIYPNPPNNVSQYLEIAEYFIKNDKMSDYFVIKSFYSEQILTSSLIDAYTSKKWSGHGILIYLTNIPNVSAAKGYENDYLTFCKNLTNTLVSIKNLILECLSSRKKLKSVQLTHSPHICVFADFCPYIFSLPTNKYWSLRIYNGKDTSILNFDYISKYFTELIPKLEQRHKYPY